MKRPDGLFTPLELSCRPGEAASNGTGLNAAAVAVNVPDERSEEERQRR